MKYERTIEPVEWHNWAKPTHRSTRDICKSRCDWKRVGRVELLPADLSVYRGGKLCWRCDFPLGSEAVSTSCLDSVYRLWVLPSVASEKMPESAKHDRVRSIMGLGNSCCHLNLLSSSNGERGGGAACAVIS